MSRMQAPAGNVFVPQSDHSMGEDFIRYWERRMPAELELTGIEAVHCRPSRQVYRARSAAGPVAVKVCWGGYLGVPAWLAALQPRIAGARPPALVHARTEPAAEDAFPFTCLISEWIEGGGLLRFSNRGQVRALTRCLAHLHSVVPDDDLPPTPVHTQLRAESGHAGHPFRILVDRAIRSIAETIEEGDAFDPEPALRRARRALDRLYEEDGPHPLIHASLKPDHVRIDAAGEPRMIDMDKACFAPCEPEVADVVARICSRKEFRERLKHEMKPLARYRPSAFERDYFELRGRGALKRWKRHRREAFVVAGLIALGRRARVLRRRLGEGPEPSPALSRDVSKAWRKFLKVIGEEG